MFFLLFSKSSNLQKKLFQPDHLSITHPRYTTDPTTTDTPTDLLITGLTAVHPVHPHVLQNQEAQAVREADDTDKQIPLIFQYEMISGLLFYFHIFRKSVGIHFYFLPYFLFKDKTLI